MPFDDDFTIDDVRLNSTPPDPDEIRTYAPVKRSVVTEMGLDEWSGPYDVKFERRDDGYVDIKIRRSPCLTL